MELVRNAYKTAAESRRAYIVLNLVYYGLIVCAMIFVSFDRSVQQALLDATGTAWESGPLAVIGEAYGGGQILAAVGLTFVVNLVVGSFACINLPSLVIPFSGLVVGMYRAVLWGLLFSPTTLDVSGAQVLTGLLIAGVILLEGQGYVLGMLAAYDQGMALLKPSRVGAASRVGGYWAGVKRSLRIYVLVALVLMLAAVYEVLVAVIVLPLLS